MYSLTVENHKGEKLQLTQNVNYNVLSVQGLNPPNANINTATNANFDGSTFKSSRLNERNIVIELTIEGDIETNRIALYKYFKNKHAVKVYYANGTRYVYINGYVESFEVNLFEQKQKAQISIVCPKPYFIDVNTSLLDFTSIEALFEFPFAIEEEGTEFSTLLVNQTKVVYNAGDVATGINIELKANGLTLNPKIYNVETGESIILDIEMNTGDIVKINTNAGEKSITMIVDTVETNIINRLRYGSTWLQLESGDNIFLYTADEFPENLTCSFIYSDKYEGV